MQTQVKSVRFRDLHRLQRQFRQAAATSFSYLEGAHQQEILAQNSLPRLAAAWIRPSRILLGIYQNSELKGYAIGSCAGQTAQLYWLYVLPELRGHNAGLKLLAAAIRRAEHRRAHRLVLATHSHHDYYHRQGFEKLERQEVHGVPMDIMALKLGRTHG